MSRGSDQIGTYLAGYFGTASLIPQLKTVDLALAYLVGNLDASANARPKTVAQLTAALDVIQAPTGADPYLIYYPNYVAAYFQATVGQTAPLTSATSGGGLPLEGVNASPALSQYASKLGRLDANGPDVTSEQVFAAHADIPGGGILSVNSGFAACPQAGVTLLRLAASNITTYTVWGKRPTGVVETETIVSVPVGNLPLVGQAPFSELIGIASDRDPGGVTTVRQIVPVRSRASLVLALQAVFS